MTPGQDPAATIEDMTSSRTSLSRGPVVGAVLGLLLLVGMVAFAVGLPEASGTASGTASSDSAADTTGSAATPDTVVLPDEVAGGLVSALSDAAPEELLAAYGGRESLATSLDAAQQGIEDLYGAPSAFALYADAAGSAGATVTVAPGEPGIFLPDGAPISAEAQGVARSTVVVTRADGATCSATFAEPVAAGQPVDENEVPSGVQCQLDSTGDGLTYQLTGGGLTVAGATAVLRSVADAQER